MGTKQHAATPSSARARTFSVDWPQILTDMAYLLGEARPGAMGGREPVGSPTLAKALGRKRSTVVGWMDGSEPRHSDGEMLIERWCALTGKSEAFVPKQARQLSASEMR